MQFFALMFLHLYFQHLCVLGSETSPRWFEDVTTANSPGEVEKRCQPNVPWGTRNKKLQHETRFHSSTTSYNNMQVQEVVATCYKYFTLQQHTTRATVLSRGPPMSNNTSFSLTRKACKRPCPEKSSRDAIRRELRET